VNASISWEEAEQTREADWRSENGVAAHKKVLIADDVLTADAAYRLACEGTAILWRGDFQNARQLLQALVRRVDRPSKKSKRASRDANGSVQKTSIDTFNLHRLSQSQRARILGMLLVECSAEHVIALKRAPDVQQACNEAYGAADRSYLVSLREILGVISAHEWRKKGVLIPALSHTNEVRIYPHYGVFSPIRGEYIDLVYETPLPKSMMSDSSAFDIGIGTGVLSIALALRGVKKIIGTDLDERALACAKENIARLHLDSQIEIMQTNLFPPGKASLIICNPPWLPARPSSSLERAVYDPESQMLKGFLNRLSDHLLDGGEGWLIISDLAEHLGLRRPAELIDWIDQAGLLVLGRVDTKAKHKKVFDQSDALHQARSAEVTSLWRLTKKQSSNSVKNNIPTLFTMIIKRVVNHHCLA
jgi:methylase of polypeptide subunit release factors